MKKSKFQWRKFVSLVLTVLMITQNCMLTSAGEISAPDAAIEQSTDVQADAEAKAAEESEAAAKAAAESEAAAKAAAESEAAAKAAAESEAAAKAAAESEAAAKAAAESEAAAKAAAESEAAAKAAAESEAAAKAAAESEAATEAQTTEAVTEATEAQTTETATEATEAQTTEAVTEATEAQTTEAATEATEAQTTEAVTEATEAVTEATEEQTTEAVTEEETTEAQTEEETKVEEYQVTFDVEEGATVTVDGKDVTNQTVAVKDGKIVFTVSVEDGYKIKKVVAKKQPVPETENENEYVLEVAKDTTVKVRVGEEEAKTKFKYEDDKVVIKATVPEEAKLSEDVELVASEMSGNKYDKAVEAVEAADNAGDDVIHMVDYVGYNVHFELDGDKVQPEADGIEFTVKYKDGAFEESDIPIESYTTYQLDAGLNNAQEVAENGNAKAEFESSESDYGIMTMAQYYVTIRRIYPQYLYRNSGYGTGGTYKYQITYNGRTINTICVRPRQTGLNGGFSNVTVETLSNPAIARLTYYAYNPGKLRENWGKSLTDAQVFILCHIAAGYLYNHSNNDWAYGANGTAQSLALELASWAGGQPTASLSKSTSGAGISYSGGEWVERSATYTFNSSYCLPSITVNVPANVTMYVGGKPQTGSVTIARGKSFYFTCKVGSGANLTPTWSYTIPPHGSVSVVKGSSKGRSYQDFAAANGEAGSDSIKLDVTWNNKQFHFTKNGETDENKSSDEQNFLDGTVLAICKNADGTDELFSWNITGKVLAKTEDITLNSENGKKLKPGTYYLVDKEVSSGYTKTALRFTVLANGDINVANNSYLTLQNKLTQLKIRKVGPAGENLAVGLTITGTKAYDITLTSAHTEEVIKGIPEGDYVLTETDPQDGFTIAEPIKFHVALDGTVTITDDGGNGMLTKDADGFIITMKDEKIDVKMVKRATEGNTSANLAGATYRVFEMPGESLVGDVVSEGTAKQIGGDKDKYKLKVDTDYRLVEITPPVGYQAMDGYVDFHIDTKGNVTDVKAVVKNVENSNYVGIEGNTIILRDDLTQVQVKKEQFAALAGVKTLEGAELQILDGEDPEKKVATNVAGETLEWTSTNEEWVIKGLTVNHQYILHEKKAPVGFKLAEDIPFTIDLNGNVKNIPDNLIVMTDTLYMAGFRKVTADTKGRTDTVQLAIRKELEGDNVVLKNYMYPDGYELLWEAKIGETKDVYGLPEGHYYLVEIDAPRGYAKNYQEFDIEADQAADMPVEEIVTLTNHETRVQVGKVFESKTDAMDDFVVTFELTRKDGSEIVMNDGNHASIEITITNKNEWRTEENGEISYWSEIEYGLPTGEYVLTETSAPAGYTWAEPVEFTVDDEMNEDRTDSKLVAVGPVVNKKNRIAFAKVNEAGDMVPFVELEVLDAEGNVAKTIFDESLEWTTDGTLKEFEGLPEGTYKLHEVSAPAEYTVNKVDVDFTVAANGTVTSDAATVSDDGVVVITMVNRKTKLIITKNFEDGYVMKEGDAVVFELQGPKATAEGEFGEDATVQEVKLTRESGLVAELEGLKTGFYTLTETSAPEGFHLADAVTFEVTNEQDEQGNVVVAEVTVDDFANRIQFTKVDRNGVQVKGSHLQVVDENGNVAKSCYDEELDWYTDGNVKEFKGLAAGKYTLREIDAPEGFLAAEDIEFTVAENQTSDTAVQVVRMVDEVAGSIEVTKVVVDEATGEYTETNYTFYTALFADEALTQRISDVKALTVDGTYSTSVTFTDLPCTTGDVESATYYVAETDSAGNPITSDPVIVRNEIENSKVTLTPEAATAASTITNYVTGTRGYYDNGEITLNKQVLVNNQPKEVNETFYFALFADEARTMLVSPVMAMVLNGESSGTITFEEVDFGEYYLSETDSLGNPVGGGFAYDVTIDADHFTLSQENQNMTVNVTNSQEEMTESESESESEIESESEEQSESEKKKEKETEKKKEKESETNGALKAASVKTGDNTPLMTLVLLLAASALVILFVGFRRRKGNR